MLNEALKDPNNRIDVVANAKAFNIGKSSIVVADVECRGRHQIFAIVGE